MQELIKVVVSHNIQIAPNAWLLKFPRPFDFQAGQVLGITLDKNLQPRSYSIASGVDNDEIWILYTVKPDGLLTPPLSRVRRGDAIYITPAFGNFICKDEKAVWIATGTGIAPFASMFFSGQYHNKTLIQGSGERANMYFYEHFKGATGFSYHPCCSRERTADCFHGRVTDFVKNLDPVDTKITYYLCGIAEMVVDTRDLLIERGVPFNNIMAEIFF
jgi:ferredoxin/flavodoxin---NADP+ reductase